MSSGSDGISHRNIMWFARQQKQPEKVKEPFILIVSFGFRETTYSCSTEERRNKLINKLKSEVVRMESYDIREKGRSKKRINRKRYV